MAESTINIVDALRGQQEQLKRLLTQKMWISDAPKATLSEIEARLAILRRVGGSAAHGSWEGLGSLEGVQDQAKFGLRDYRIGRCGGSRKRRFL